MGRQDDLLERFFAARRRTERLCEPLLAEDFVVQSMPDVSPPNLHLGHTSWFFEKMLLFIFMFIWLRGTLPRLRYDQFMAFGWKRLIPISLGWIVAVSTVRALQGQIEQRHLLIGVGILAVLFLVLFFVGEGDEETTDARHTREPGPVDAFAGGFPVPPMPAGGAVRGGAAPLTFADRRTTVTSTGTSRDDRLDEQAAGDQAGEENR